VQTSPYPVIIAGPTASGKTDLALALAAKTGGVIISVDSRQVYKGLGVCTAAPAGKWTNGKYLVNGIPYYLVDIIGVNEKFDAFKFISLARAAADENKDRQIIFAGGTGLYLQGYFCGLDKLPAADESLRAELKDLAQKCGNKYLHDRLAKVDAACAARIPAGNTHGVIRALEIFTLTGKAASQLKKIEFDGCEISKKAEFIYLDWDKELLNERIAKRAKNTFKSICDEVKVVLESGYDKDSPGLKSLGCREAALFLEGALSQEQAIEKIVFSTRRYAKRQRTWFARYETNKIALSHGQFDADGIAEQIIARIGRRRAQKNQ
jgi:tRNA dimethylallyltransferase